MTPLLLRAAWMTTRRCRCGSETACVGGVCGRCLSGRPPRTRQENARFQSKVLTEAMAMAGEMPQPTDGPRVLERVCSVCE